MATPGQKSPEIFPLSFSMEEETGMQVAVGKAPLDEPYDFASRFSEYIPPRLVGFQGYLTNGGRLYVGGADGDQYTNFERADPECSSPREAVIYNRAGELILFDMLADYAADSSDSMQQMVGVRTQRRVVDSNGSRKGMHDNFGLDRKSPLISESGTLPPTFLYFLGSRSFMTGAGLVEDAQLSYAQKIGGLAEENGYKNSGSMYRIEINNGRGENPRLEIRCGDINLSDWAAEVRLGSMALLLALYRTPSKGALDQAAQLQIDPITHSKKINALLLGPDGSLTATRDQLSGVAFLELIARLALDKLPNYADVASYYSRIAKEMLHYCADYRKVLADEASISLLADRADWATKFSLILEGMARDKGSHQRRTLYDARSRSTDLYYDYRGLVAMDGKIVSTQRGTAYKLRDQGHFKDTVRSEHVKQAYYHPPTGTRAALRGLLLSRYKVIQCRWGQVIINEKRDETVTVDLPNVRQTTFTPTNIQELERYRPIWP